MLGAGTVGGGVYTLLAKSSLANITKICVRDLKKPRDFTVNASITSFTDSVEDLMNDPNINCIIEVCGGTSLAKDVVLRALSSGKHVVTANKALIAQHMDELTTALSTAPGPPQFCYEAAVCGGIPIINALQSSYSSDSVTSISGICNGTTNYMLCKMEEGADYSEVLAEAQALGYAEADPTADVEGHDVRSKIAILAKLGFGVTVPVSTVPTKGISSITSVDFEYAKVLKSTIKLIGTASLTSVHSEHDGPLSVYVSPKMVPLTHMLANARGAGNAVQVDSSNMGTTGYIGPGAGRYPTANSVVSDVLRIARGESPATPFPKTGEVALQNDYTSMFYIRISIQDGLGIIRRVGELAEKHGVSINSVLQNDITDREKVDFVVTTEACLLSQVEGMCKDVEVEDFCNGGVLVMPIMGSD